VWFERLKSYRFLYIVLFVLIISGLGIYIIHLDRNIDRQVIQKVGDRLFSKLHSELEEQKSGAFAFALTLAQNSDLARALEDDNEEKGYELLSRFMTTVSKYTPYTVRAQVITADYCIFARSWDNNFAGMPLDLYRPDLLDFEANKKPRVAIEVGRRMGIKATVPVFGHDDVIGFVEVLQFFGPVTQMFKAHRIDVIVLMEDRFLTTATLMRENPTLKGYVVANQAVNRFHIDNLGSSQMETLRYAGHVVAKTYHYFYEPLFDGRGERIGAAIIAVDQQQMDYLKNEDSDLSFFLNMTRPQLYSIIKSKEEQGSIYQSVYDHELLYLKDTLEGEDRELFLKEAHERLSTYSKEALIDIILGHNFSKKIGGEIR